MRSRGKHTRRQFVVKAGALAALPLGSLAGCRIFPTWGKRRNRTGPSRPNIILFVTDDQRWDAMGCMGNRIIKTPHLDWLAREGVLFTQNFCTTSICMSSRASIFTGMYTRRHQINSFKQPLDRDKFALTYPVLLRRAGYRTGFVGKWGLGGPLPAESFDYFKGFSGQGRYFHVINGKKVHLTRILTDQAIEFIRQGERSRPFCLSLSFKAPHVQDAQPDPFRYDPAYEDLYKDVEIPLPKTADEKYFKALPEFIQKSEGRIRWKRRFSTPELYQKSVKGYYRLITGVDTALGKIISALGELGTLDNTVIIWTADNGFFLGEHGLAGKWLMYEESIRTPLIVYDPRLPKPLLGRQCQEMTLNIDLAPTILDYAGLCVSKAMQGLSLRPLVEQRETRWRDDWFYEHHFRYGGRIPRSEGVRTKRWKYIRYLDTTPPYEELFDLSNDPYEERNIISDPQHCEVVESLRKRWEVFRRSLV